MCKGSDIIKVAAVAAAVYTGGASMGLWGAAEAAGAGAAAAGAAGGAAGGTGLTLGAAGATGLTAGAAGTGLSTAAAGAGFDAGLASLFASGAGAVAAGTALADGTQAAAPAARTASGGTSTGASFLGALKTGAQLAPLASLAMMGMQPKMEAQGIPGVSPAPDSQAAKTPAPNIFKKKIQGIDPTQTSGVGGVSDISLGKATVLGQ